MLDRIIVNSAGEQNAELMLPCGLMLKPLQRSCSLQRSNQHYLSDHPGLGSVLATESPEETWEDTLFTQGHRISTFVNVYILSKSYLCETVGVSGQVDH